MNSDMPAIPSEIRASGFVLVNDDGRPCGGFEVAEGEPRLTLRDHPAACASWQV